MAPDALALRFVRDPDGQLVLDLKGSLPGRGAWLTPARSHLLTALKKGSFARSLKAPTNLPAATDAETFADQIAETLKTAALSRLGLARKAGALMIGKDAARDSKGKAIAYLTPNDASAAEVAKVAALLEKAAGTPHHVLPLSRHELGCALGQDGVHVVLLRHPVGAKALAAIDLWAHFTSR